MRAATLARLAVAGNRTDHLRTTLTALSAALASVTLLSAATVMAIRGGAWIDQPNGERILGAGSDQYASALLAEQGLRPGVITALILLSLPVLALAGQCIRLGAPARDRRLAAIRLAGATPRQAILIAGAETVAAGLLGSVAGFGVFLLLRVLLDSRNAAGKLALPTDILPSPVAMVIVILLVPVLAGAVGALLLRQVLISPLGVVRRTRERGPWPWPGVLIVVGLALFELPEHIKIDGKPLAGQGLGAVLAGGLVLTVVGVVLGTGWISYTAGRLLHRFGPRPAMLLAGRRLMADPWNGSRTLAAVLASVVVGTIALGVRAELIAEFRESDRDDQGFYLGAINLVMVAVGIGITVAAAGVLVALTDSIVARRRAYAALTANGVPRGTLSQAVLWQTLGPAVPALLLALVAGAGIIRLMAGVGNTTETTTTTCEAACQAGTAPPTVVVEQLESTGPTVHLPVDLLALLGGGAFLAVLIAAGIGLLVLRASTDLDELRV